MQIQFIVGIMQYFVETMEQDDFKSYNNYNINSDEHILSYTHLCTINIRCTRFITRIVAYRTGDGHKATEEARAHV